MAVKNKTNSKGFKLSMPVLAIVVLGVLTAIGVFSLVSKAKVDVLVPKSPIEARTKVTASMFTYKTIDKASAPRGAIVRGQENQLENRLSAGLLVPDVPVVASQFLGEDSKTSLTARVPDGKVIVSLPTDPVKGVSSTITTNDKVNIYSTISNDALGTETKLIFQNVQIVDLQKNNKALTAITIAVTPKEAEELLYAQTAGDIHFAVVPYNYKEVTTDGMNDNQFIKKNVNNGGALSGIKIVSPSDNNDKNEKK
ncbi:Flp pilus assembly protein CpaB [Neobacillus sp. YIM B02564]|uniref:Flp pilus assembly protein CpaB n=1 Tax=Neobacillus paridis TaxID=2803862 RepID=A0ABS1TMA0_9BACI|nr:Flp pilus assembly protein CpaB [Neobacillus paridis]MBL4952129.1 Flp pilus assembly protein CpaB [Neobacillus paridis]